MKIYHTIVKIGRKQTHYTYLCRESEECIFSLPKCFSICTNIKHISNIKISTQQEHKLIKMIPISSLITILLQEVAFRVI